MRGARQFANHFVEANNVKCRKGRSEVLHEKRNELLFARYSFYGVFTKWRYEVVIEVLSEEFFLSPVTIPEILDDNRRAIEKAKKELKELHKSQAVKRLSQRWPHIEWDRAITSWSDVVSRKSSSN